MIERNAHVPAKHRKNSFHSIIIKEKWNGFTIKIHFHCKRKDGNVLKSTASDIRTEKRKTKYTAIQAACKIVRMETSHDSTAPIRKRLTEQKTQM